MEKDDEWLEIWATMEHSGESLTGFDSAIREEFKSPFYIDLIPILLDKKIEDLGNVVDESGRLKRIITDIFRDNMCILRLEPYTFEEVVAELFRSQGGIVHKTKRTRDGGYDLQVISQLHGEFPLRFLVECKMYTSDKVGIDAVRQLMYVVDKEKANKGIIATTSYFTRDARLEKEHSMHYKLDLKDKDDILRWIKLYCQKAL